MAKKKKAAAPDAAAEATAAEAIARYIAAHPTASDAQVAAAADAPRALVTDVRAGMGAKHTWPKEETDG